VDGADGSESDRAMGSRPARSMTPARSGPVVVSAQTPTQAAAMTGRVAVDAASRSVAPGEAGRSSAGPSPPIIQVTIGRIEVRATAPAAPSVPQRRRRPVPAAMSLDDYLERNAGGKR